MEPGLLPAMDGNPAVKYGSSRCLDGSSYEVGESTSVVPLLDDGLRGYPTLIVRWRQFGATRASDLCVSTDNGSGASIYSSRNMSIARVPSIKS